MFNIIFHVQNTNPAREYLDFSSPLTKFAHPWLTMIGSKSKSSQIKFINPKEGYDQDEYPLKPPPYKMNNNKKRGNICTIVCSISLLCLVTILFVLYGNLEAKMRGISNESGNEIQRFKLLISKLYESEEKSREKITVLEIMNLKLKESKENFQEKITELEKMNSQLKGIVTKTKQMARKSVVGWNDCGELFDNGFSEDDVYTITSRNIPFQTYCDMESGGWTVFQRRFDGSTNFRQNFETFTRGFGDVENEYWLGLEKVHQLTRVGNWTLRIELLAYDNDYAYAEYSDFSIGDGPGYRLHVGAYNGTAGDCLVYHNGMKFSTYDKDQDESPSLHCSRDNNHGSWWFKDCNRCNLNSFIYGNAERRAYKGMNYYEFKSLSTPLKATKLMIRRR